MLQQTMGDLVHVPRRVVRECAHACSRARVVDNAFVEGAGGSRAFMYFHSANRVRGHKAYLPAEFSDCEVARIDRTMVCGSMSLRQGSYRVQTRDASIS
jgi:hypothetical protein